MKQSFVIEVQSRQNHSWQGTITWVEAQKKECFRSALEMLKLIDSTMEEEGQEEQNMSGNKILSRIMNALGLGLVLLMIRNYPEI